MSELEKIRALYSMALDDLIEAHAQVQRLEKAAELVADHLHAVNDLTRPTALRLEQILRTALSLPEENA